MQNKAKNLQIVCNGCPKVQLGSVDSELIVCSVWAIEKHIYATIRAVTSGQIDMSEITFLHNYAVIFPCLGNNFS